MHMHANTMYLHPKVRECICVSAAVSLLEKCATNIFCIVLSSGVLFAQFFLATFLAGIAP